MSVPMRLLRLLAPVRLSTAADCPLTPVDASINSFLSREISCCSISIVWLYSAVMASKLTTCRLVSVSFSLISYCLCVDINIS